jgi:hypothetical protein
MYYILVFQPWIIDTILPAVHTEEEGLPEVPHLQCTAIWRSSGKLKGDDDHNKSGPDYLLVIFTS